MSRRPSVAKAFASVLEHVCARLSTHTAPYIVRRSASTTQLRRTTERVGRAIHVSRAVDWASVRDLALCGDICDDASAPSRRLVAAVANAVRSATQRSANAVAGAPKASVITLSFVKTARFCSMELGRDVPFAAVGDPPIHCAAATFRSLNSTGTGMESQFASASVSLVVINSPSSANECLLREEVVGVLRCPCAVETGALADCPG